MALAEMVPSPAQVHARADETGLRSQIIHTIRDYANNSPRSLQRAIGPSEVGTPCARQLAFKMSDREPTRDVHDPWPSIMGTAGHAWLEGCFSRANRDPSNPEWLTERRLDVGFGLKGSCDVFHVPTGSSLDWKILGDTQYKKYVNEGPSEGYRVQGHCYGLGWLRAGYQVNRVGICFLGRSKRLSDLHIWSEPFDVEIALRALKRLRTLQQIMASRRADGSPVDPMQIPESPGGACFFCGFRSTNNGADGYCCGKE